jgi:hypothetical protein
MDLERHALSIDLVKIIAVCEVGTLKCDQDLFFRDKKGNST